MVRSRHEVAIHDLDFDDPRGASLAGDPVVMSRGYGGVEIGAVRIGVSVGQVGVEQPHQNGEVRVIDLDRRQEHAPQDPLQITHCPIPGGSVLSP